VCRPGSDTPRKTSLLTTAAEYDDDTTIIQRSTTVVARRMPAKVSGRGGAARYVSGKMPIHAKNSSRKEPTAKAAAKAPSKTMVQLSNAMTEEEKMAAVFQAQTEQFSAREEEMATYAHLPLPLRSRYRAPVLTETPQTTIRSQVWCQEAGQCSGSRPSPGLHLLSMWRKGPLDPAVSYQRQPRVRQPAARQAHHRHPQVLPQDC